MPDDCRERREMTPSPRVVSDQIKDGPFNLEGFFWVGIKLES
jgi:hypothetical protein